MTRLFVALDLPEAVRAALPGPGEGWRAVPKENLHVTLAFLGRRDDPDAVVAAVRPRPVTQLTLEQAVLLPPRRPRVMAVRLAGDVSELQSSVATALDAVEARPYLPHITIGRARERPSRALPVVPPLTFSAPSVTVYESRLSPRGATYVPLASFPVLTIASDPEELRAVRLAALEESPGSFLSTHAEEAARPATDWEGLAARSAAGARDRVFLAPGRAGMVGARLEGEEAVVWGMWVAPAARGRGLGRELLDAAVGWARAVGATRVRLSVRHGAPDAASLYRSAGFVESGRSGDQTHLSLGTESSQS